MNQQAYGISEHHLVAVDGENHRLTAATVTAYKAMREAAAKAGIDLAIASGFRSFQRQLAIWNNKWMGVTPILDGNSQPLDAAQLSDEQKLWAILHWSALPGASRHHWGTDFDIYDPRPFAHTDRRLQLIPDEYEHNEGPCYQLHQWLMQHAPQYGFFLPYAQYHGGVAREPWHLSYRPEAEPLLTTMSSNDLRQLLADSDIAGKATILANLDTIMSQYVTNIEHSTE